LVEAEDYNNTSNDLLLIFPREGMSLETHSHKTKGRTALFQSDSGKCARAMLVAGLAIKGWGAPSSNWILAGALFYFIATFLVTALGNVPLNEQLAAVTATDAAAVTVWEHYLNRWTLLNTVRTVAATAVAFSFTVGLMQHAS
jgi:uncharacterized membrane protein